MKRKNYKIKYIFIFLAVIILTFSYIISHIGIITKGVENVKVVANQEPIDKNTGIINNKYFGISEDNAKSTTNGINAAIIYAYKNNIKYIKLQTGSYPIMLDNNSRAIVLQSNITMDLNGSILQLQSNSNPTNRAFYLNNVENVKICNGKIIGDRLSHDFSGQDSN